MPELATPESPWDYKNPETLDALIETHAESYCEDVAFGPFLQQWRDDRTALAASQERVRELEALVMAAKPIVEWAGGNVCASWLRRYAVLRGPETPA